MVIKVYKDGLDWMFFCKEHDEKGFAAEWLHALEMAYGHAAMYHSPEDPLWIMSIKDRIAYAKKIYSIVERLT